MTVGETLRPDVSVVIVTYNCQDVIGECLVSVRAQAEPPFFEIVVVDNASSDDSLARVRLHDPRAQVVANRSNYYYRAAANQGARISRGRYVLFLNPDTRLVGRNVLRTLTDHLDRNPAVAAAGARLLDPDGAVQMSCRRLPGLGWLALHCLRIGRVAPGNPVERYLGYGGWDRSGTRVVDSVSGACIMVRREVFDEIGGYDEGCRMYWEEADLGRALRRGGWKTAHVGNAEVVHHWRGGGSNASPSALLRSLIEEAMHHYYSKYFGWRGRGLLAIHRFVSRCVSLLRERQLPAGADASGQTRPELTR